MSTLIDAHPNVLPMLLLPVYALVLACFAFGLHAHIVNCQVIESMSELIPSATLSASLLCNILICLIVKVLRRGEKQRVCLLAFCSIKSFAGSSFVLCTLKVQTALHGIIFKTSCSGLSCRECRFSMV